MKQRDVSNQEFFNLISDILNLRGKLTGFVRKDTTADNGARDTTGTSKGYLGRDEYVGHVLVEKKNWEYDV